MERELERAMERFEKLFESGFLRFRNSFLLRLSPVVAIASRVPCGMIQFAGAVGGLGASLSRETLESSTADHRRDHNSTHGAAAIRPV